MDDNLVLHGGVLADAFDTEFQKRQVVPGRYDDGERDA
jgi:hypothetical protein